MLLRSLVLLSVFWCSAFAETAGALHERSNISPRQTRECNISGWIPVCPGAFPCMPPSGTCCSGNYYHLPGGTCPRGTYEVPRIGQSAPPPASITLAPTPIPAPAPPIVLYTSYTYTITWYYFYYYYYYTTARYQLTSTRTTYFTTISLAATNEAAANSAFAEVSKTITFATPTQAGTPTLGSVLPPTSTSVVAPSSSKALVIPSSSNVVLSSKAVTPTINSTLPSSTSIPPQFTGAAAGLRVGSVLEVQGAFILLISTLIIGLGMLMLWL